MNTLRDYGIQPSELAIREVCKRRSTCDAAVALYLDDTDRFEREAADAAVSAGGVTGAATGDFALSPAAAAPILDHRDHRDDDYHGWGDEYGAPVPAAPQFAVPPMPQYDAAAPAAPGALTPWERQLQETFVGMGVPLTPEQLSDVSQHGATIDGELFSE